MTANLTISVASRNAMIAAMIALVEAGGGAKLRIYSGTQPASPDVAPGVGNALLAEFALPVPAFTAGGNGLVQLAGPVLQVTAVATGEATWFRLVNAAGTGVVDGTVGLTTDPAPFPAIALNTRNFVIGVAARVSALNLTQPATC